MMKKLLPIIILLGFWVVHPLFVYATNSHSTDLENTSSQYWSITDASQTGLDISGDFTIEAWVKLESQPANNKEFVIAGKYKSASSFSAYHLGYINDSGNKYIRGVYTDSGGSALAFTTGASGALSDGTWYHIAAAINATSGAWNIYVNGSSVDSGTNTAPFTIETNASAFNVGFGASQGGDNYFDGLIDDVRVWNDVRTSSEVSSNYNCALAGTEANLQAYWRFDNNGNDSTANANNLTNNNSATFASDVNFTADCSGGGGGGGSSSTAGITYTYDNVGNITQITDNSTIGTGKTLVLSYDDLHRLTRASTTAASSTPFLETYAYSSIGNITNKSDQGAYTYAETSYANPHAVTSLAGTSLTYDNNGNVLTYGSNTYAWDYRNQLTSAGNGVSTSTYAYDFQRNRVKKTESATTTTYANKYFATTGATTTKYIYAGDTLIATIERTDIGTTTNVVHADHLGSTYAISSATGTVVQALDYYPYGSIRINTQQAGFNQKRKYIGELYDEERSLSYLNARYYEGSRGQFLSQDPVFLVAGDEKLVIEKTKETQEKMLSKPQQLNSYSYAENNPIIKKDPEGNAVLDLSLGLSRYVVGGSVGVKVELFSNWGYQTYFSTSLGPQFGAYGQIKFDPQATLSPGGTYTEREFIASYYGGISRTTQADFKPENPFSLTDNPKTSHSLVVGAVAGYTNATVDVSEPRYFGNQSTKEGSQNSTVKSVPDQGQIDKTKGIQKTTPNK